jgi:hypothetical protein
MEVSIPGLASINIGATIKIEYLVHCEFVVVSCNVNRI